tara:strand:+ start:3993 stop:5504 length:1512 start_codon:yes stop_codon:yes gene_type:complete
LLGKEKLKRSNSMPFAAPKEKNIWLPTAIIVAILYSSSILWGLSKIETYLYVFLALGFTAYGFIYYKKWVYFLTIGLIPVSVGFELSRTGMNVSTPSELLEFLLLGIFIVYLLLKGVNKKIFYHPLSILLLLDLIWLIISSMFSTLPDVSFKRVLMKLNYLFVFYFLLAELSYKKPLTGIKPLLFYALGLIYPMYHTLKMHIHYDFNPKVVFSISAPFYSDHTIYGACLAFITPLLIMAALRNKKLKINQWGAWFFGIILLLVLVSQALALSRAAMLSLIVALLFYGLIRLRVHIRFLIGMLLVLSIGTYAFKDELYGEISQNEAVSNDGDVMNHVSSVTNVESDASNLERINRWVCAWEMFKEKPLTGFGPGTYQFEYAQFQSSQYKTYISTTHGDRGNAHSEYLSYLSETGIVGFILFVVIVFYSIHLGLVNYYNATDPAMKQTILAVLLGLVTFYFHGIFNAFSDQDKMAFLYYGSLGMLLLADINLKNQIESTQTNANF